MVEGRRLVPLELERAVHQLVDGIACRHAETGIELATTLDRTGEDRFEKTKWRRKVRDPQQLGQCLLGAAECIVLSCPSPKLAPEAHRTAERELPKLLLVPPNQR